MRPLRTLLVVIGLFICVWQSNGYWKIVPWLAIAIVVASAPRGKKPLTEPVYFVPKRGLWRCTRCKKYGSVPFDYCDRGPCPMEPLGAKGRPSQPDPVDTPPPGQPTLVGGSVTGRALCLNDSTILVGTSFGHKEAIEEAQRQLNAWTKEPVQRDSRRPGMYFRTDSYEVVLPGGSINVDEIVAEQKRRWGQA